MAAEQTTCNHTIAPGKTSY